VLTFPSTVRVYLAPGPTDMRKSFDTLSALAREVLERDPLSGHLFAFCGRRRTLIKILVWDGTGFWLFAKRLARGTFAWPAVPADGARRIDLRPDELAALLSGIDLGSATRRRWWRKDPKALEAS
jgi:transposase